ncbi:hypothetical protein D3C78_1120460 [compost metagenome]
MFQLPFDLMQQSRMQSVLPDGPPGQHRAIDALADPGDEVAKPYRGRLGTFGPSPTQLMTLMWIVVFVAPDKEIVVADTLSAIILRDIPQIVIQSISGPGIEDFYICAIAAALFG